MTVESPFTADMQKLFSNCDCYTPGDPSQFGFYDLQLPDAYRWISSMATCLLKPPVITLQSQLVLLITSNSSPLLGDTRLSVEVNGVHIGEKPILVFGNYYFNVESSVVNKFDKVKVVLKVNNKPIEENGKRLALTIYCVKLIDVEKDNAGFDERALFIDQIKIFRPDASRLSKILDEKKLSAKSIILDIGSGVGWTTVLLAARTGARTTAIDPNHYKNGNQLKPELNERFFRHLSALKREPGFGAVQSHTDMTRAIERCSFLMMSAMEMDFKDNTFDFVFSLNAFEHIPDPAAALKEIKRVLKPGGEAYIHFHLPYYSDGGSHLAACGLLNKPWAHLLYGRNEIRRLVIEAGNVPNEIDNILDSLNGWSCRQFHDLFMNSGLSIVSKDVIRGFTIQGADQSEEFTLLKQRYSEDELTTIGMVVHLRKKRRQGFTSRLKRIYYKLCL